MSAASGQGSLEKHLQWLGFELSKKVYTDIEHDLTLDDLIASLKSNKRDPDKRCGVDLTVQLYDEGAEITLRILVRSITQVYVALDNGAYANYAEWAFEGWIMTPDVVPTPNAPSVRCFFEGGGGDYDQLYLAELQFINPLPF